MKFFHSRVKKLGVATALLPFFFVAVFSVGIGMQMDDMGNMAPCAFMMGETAICPMGVSEHIDEWNGLFAPISSVFTLSLFVAVFFFAVADSSFFIRERILQKKRQLYFINHSYFKSLHFLVFLFSRGILNPRLYAFAII